MTDLESRVTASLAARAQRSVEVDRLRSGALLRASAMRRRRARRGVGLAGLAAVVLAGALTLPGALGSSGQAPPTTLPPATGTAPAAEAPQAIGTDPAVLHFDLDLAGLDVSATEWVSSLGYERAMLHDGSGSEPWASVYLAHTSEALEAAAAPALATTRRPAEQTTVDARPATLQRVVVVSTGGVTWELRWQPRPGIQAAVSVRDDRALAFTVAAAIRLDRAQRCAVPLRLSELPAAAAWVRCQTMLRRAAPRPDLSPSAHWGVTVRRADGHDVLVWAGEPGRTTEPLDLTVAGHPARWRPDLPGLWVAGFGPVDVFITAVPPTEPGWLTQLDAVWLAERVQVAGDLDAPGTWPARAVG
jgi:hypothetical protein